jgi:uncharacterized protein (DUF1800 family)
LEKQGCVPQLRPLTAVEFCVLTLLSKSDWDYRTAAHLLNRAAFGGTPEEIVATREKGLEGAVHDLIEVGATTYDSPAPEWAHPRDLGAIRMEAHLAKQRGDNFKMRKARKLEGDELVDLRYWWLERIATTPTPLVEKMTLFWHSHFATSAQKVKDAYWMWLQNDTLRRHALGNFVALTKAISRDPAMMIYLDLPQSRQRHPNENWARELMELFTVGIGNYTEKDVRESARAFTGYRLDLATQRYRFVPSQHDPGPKSFLGRTGNFYGDDTIDILTQQPACAEFVARKICLYFITDEPSPPLVNSVAERMRAHKFEIKPLLWEIFCSAEFYSERVIQSQIKSPMQFIVQTCKVLGCELPAPAVAQNAMGQMGQILFAPPSVKGWDGGRSWISTSTLLFRNNFANYLINGDSILSEPAARRGSGDLGFRVAAREALTQDVHRAPIDVDKIVSSEARSNPTKLIAEMSLRILQKDPPPADAAAFSKFLEARGGTTDDSTIRGLIHLMMNTPLYQLV